MKYKPTTIVLTAVLLLGLYQGVRAGIESWSITAGSNNATPPDGAPENMAPSTVNNTMREMMAQTRKWAEQAVSGTWNADAGSANAYKITPEIVPTSLVSGQVFRFKAANTNTGDSYLQVGALSTITMVRLSDTVLSAGDITVGLVHTVVYDGTYMQLQPTTQSVVNINVVNDTTPQLGGFLDPNNNYIGITKGGDIASASPIVIDTDGDYFDVMGTTNFNTLTVSDARHFFLQFDGILTLSTSTTLDIPGNATITTAAGDVAEFVSTATDTARIVNYTRASGKPVAGISLEFVSTAPITAATTLTVTGLAAGYDYIITLEAFAPTTDAELLWMRWSDDGGATYEADASDYDYSVTRAGTSEPSGGAKAQIPLAGAGPYGNDAGNVNTLEIKMINPNSGSEATTAFWKGLHTNGTPTLIDLSGAAEFTQGVDAVDAVQFLWSGGSTFKAQGDISVWRRKRS